MISASYRNYNSYSNSRNSPAFRQSSRYSLERAATSPNSDSGLSSSNAADFIYRGANKHHWAKLQSKIKRSLMHDNISYIENEVEIARISMPPPPAAFLTPPAFLETAQDKVERQRQQKLLDEARKRNKDKYEAYQDDFAKTFPKDIAAHFAFLQGSIVTDLERTIQNIAPPTTNVMAHFRVMKERLLNKFGPNSQKNAEEQKRPSANWTTCTGTTEDGTYTSRHLTLWSKSSHKPQLEIPPTTPSRNPHQADHIYASRRVRLH